MSVTFTIDTYPPVTVPQQVTTSISAFRKWAGNNDLPENTKVFFYRGKVWINMGKQQLFTHIAVKTEITSVLYQFVKGQKFGPGSIAVGFG